MTMIVASIGAADVSRVAKLVRQALSDGADAVELRIDALENSLPELPDLPECEHPKTWIVTCRGRGEGGASNQSPDERLSLSIRAADQLAAHVDFEFDDWRTLSDKRRCALVDLLAQQEPPRRLSDYHRQRQFEPSQNSRVSPVETRLLLVIIRMVYRPDESGWHGRLARPCATGHVKQTRAGKLPMAPAIKPG